MADLEKIIASATKSGWDFFDEADPAIKERLDVRKRLEGENKDAIAHAWAEFAATPGGAKALEALYETTLGRTVYFVSLGLDMASMATFGAFREGQNALAHEIFRQIARGRGEDQPKPRETT